MVHAGGGAYTPKATVLPTPPCRLTTPGQSLGFYPDKNKG